MARINLLPWREERRKQQLKDFGIRCAFAALLGALTWYGFHSHYVGRIEYQNSRNKFLDTQIAELEKKIKEIQDLEKEKQRLIARMRGIEQLQTSRPGTVHLFDELVRTLPEGVSLKSISQKGGDITLVGTAQSNARVSNFMRNIEASEWLTKPELKVIETAATKDGPKMANFTLSLKQKLDTGEKSK
jgi:type IV pilus assembly protein PilN